MTDAERLDNGNIKLTMACAHGDARLAEMAVERARASDILGGSADNLISGILYALNFWFKGRVFSLDAVDIDMWMRVCVSEFVYGEHKYGDKLPLIMCECDRFEDGLVRIFLWINDNYERDDDEC